MDHPFRSAAVGGFNKQDVLSFLEEQSKRSAQTQQELSDRLEETERLNEELRQERDELRQQLEEARQELDWLRQERDGLKVQLDEAERDLTASQRQASENARERDELRAQLDELLPDAEAYVQIKERTAGLELDAHCRAQAIQKHADNEAQRIRREVNQWLRRMGGEYGDLRSELERIVSCAAGELERAEDCLKKIQEMVLDQEAALQGVVQTYNEPASYKVEAPMPLLEE